VESAQEVLWTQSVQGEELAKSDSIDLGPEFDNVKAFWFTAENSVFCFGMDSFYIDEAAPPQEGAVPEPGTNALLGLGLLTFAGYRCYGLKR